MPFDRLRNALRKISTLFEKSKDGKIETIEQLLLEADVGIKYTKILIDKIRDERSPIPRLKTEIIQLIDLPKPKLHSPSPFIIMLSGVNGSGKTTTAAKLASRYCQKGSVLLVSADTYRDAASLQLEFWAHRAGVEIVSSQKGQDAGAVVFDGLSKARAHSIDTVLIDTAGRLHTRIDLVHELKKIKRVITKLKAPAPDLNLVTIDATLGQNSIQQARIFSREIGINGIVLTKIDGTAKGGAIIPICNEFRLPVLYLGTGEGLDDLVEFNAKEFVEAIFGG